MQNKFKEFFIHNDGHKYTAYETLKDFEYYHYSVTPIVAVDIAALESANAERDSYAKAIALSEGIFSHKEITKAKINEVLKPFLKEAGDGK